MKLSTTVHITDSSAEWKPTSAIVFYTRHLHNLLDNTASVIATAHVIDKTGRLKNGHAMRSADFTEAAQAVANGDTTSQSRACILPACLLYHDPGNRIIWQAPERRAKLKFTKDLAPSIQNASVRHPRLIFCLEKGNNLRVFALTENKRPTADTELLTAPYWNTHSDGHVDYCQVKAPASDDLHLLPDWEDSFYLSRWSYTPSDYKFREAKKKTTLTAFWKARSKAKSCFPYAKLLPSGHTLGDLASS